MVRETGWTLDQIEEMDYEMLMWWMVSLEAEQEEQERKNKEMQDKAKTKK